MNPALKDAPVRVRLARSEDAAAITAIEASHTNVAKPAHFGELLSNSRKRTGLGLVAEMEGQVVGFVLGEVRAWEFGSPPTGWIYAVGVHPSVEGRAIGRSLLEAAAERFAKAGVGSMRTMVQRDSVALQRFFRSAGFVAGPFVELEMDCEVASV